VSARLLDLDQHYGKKGVKLRPDTISTSLGLAGVGVFYVTPSWLAPWLGWGFIFCAVCALVGGVQVENGQLGAVPFRATGLRLKQMWPQILMLVGAATFVFGLIAYLRPSQPTSGVQAEGYGFVTPPPPQATTIQRTAPSKKPPENSAHALNNSEAQSARSDTQTDQPKPTAPAGENHDLQPLRNAFYEGGQLNRQWQSIPPTFTDADIDALGQKSADWANDTANWISKNIAPAAAERFLLITPQGPVTYSLQTNELSSTSQAKFDNWYKKMPQFLANLDLLIRSEKQYRP
jgi:hypothetical protein